MKQQLEKELNEIKFLIIDDGLKYNYTISILRTILCYAAVGSITAAENIASESDLQTLADCAAKTLRPSDGDLVSIIDSTLPILWDAGLLIDMQNWFKDSISSKCNQIIFERNNRVGHGVFDLETAGKSLGLIQDVEHILFNVAPLLPISTNSGLTIIGTPFAIPFPTNEICCLREIVKKSDGWRFKYQTLNHIKSEERFGFFSTDSALTRILSEKRGALNTKTIANNWRPSYILPHVQTTSFYGRTDQIAELKEWWDDEYSRICLLYGEGGIGKTTLVLEFLNRVLEERIEVKWQPDYIFFFSSKQTRWGINGVENIPGVQANLSEAIFRLISGLDIGRIDKKWYTFSPSSLINSACELLNSIGLKGKVLLIIDNAENLIKKSQDEADLAALLKMISRKIGRVIITSRRREEIEAEPISIPPLTESESRDLLIDLLSDSHFEKPITDDEIKESVIKVGGKPILIEFLAKYSLMTKTSLQRGVHEIIARESHDLGQFLFADSWGRIEEKNRLIFMVVAQLGGFVDDVLLSFITSKFSVRREEWLSAYEETRYGEANYYGGTQEIILDEGARSFISGRYQDSLRETKRDIDLAAQECKQMYSSYLKTQREKITDRIELAFVHPLARQGKIAMNKKDFTSAKYFYEQAIISDSANPYLFDRFSWFTMKHLRDYDGAITLGKHAYALAPTDPEVNFTLGMAYSRLGLVPEADNHFSIAKNNGKERHLIQLQMAYAHYTSAWKTSNTKNENKIKINELLDSATIGTPENNFHHRHNDEIKRLRAKVNRFYTPSNLSNKEKSNVIAHQ